MQSVRAKHKKLYGQKKRKLSALGRTEERRSTRAGQSGWHQIRPWSFARKEQIGVVWKHGKETWKENMETWKHGNKQGRRARTWKLAHGRRRQGCGPACMRACRQLGRKAACAASKLCRQALPPNSRRTSYKPHSKLGQPATTPALRPFRGGGGRSEYLVADYLGWHGSRYGVAFGVACRLVWLGY